jgi:hypothetical protein
VGLRHGGIYAITNAENGRILYCAVSNVGKRVADARMFLRDRRHSNPALQADYNQNPEAILFHLVMRCSEPFLRRFVHQQLVEDGLRNGSSYNLYRVHISRRRRQSWKLVPVDPQVAPPQAAEAEVESETPKTAVSVAKVFAQIEWDYRNKPSTERAKAVVREAKRIAAGL